MKVTTTKGVEGYWSNWLPKVFFHIPYKRHIRSQTSKIKVDFNIVGVATHKLQL